jgi:hypothetical protein
MKKKILKLIENWEKEVVLLIKKEKESVKFQNYNNAESCYIKRKQLLLDIETLKEICGCD